MFTNLHGRNLSRWAMLLFLCVTCVGCARVHPRPSVKKKAPLAYHAKHWMHGYHAPSWRPWPVEPCNHPPIDESSAGYETALDEPLEEVPSESAGDEGDPMDVPATVPPHMIEPPPMPADDGAGQELPPDVQRLPPRDN